jgi:hypothetical protein
MTISREVNVILNLQNMLSHLQLQDLKMEAISSSETVVTTYKTTGRSIAGNYISKYYYLYAFLDKNQRIIGRTCLYVFDLCN